MSSDKSFNSAKDLIRYLNQSISAYHAVLSAEKSLSDMGYKRLEEVGNWELKPNGSYYVIRRESGLIAWQMGKGNLPGIRMIGAHTDSPGLRLKPNPLIMKNGYIQYGVEVYGGPLLATWTDRDLGLAGRVVVREKGKLVVKPFAYEKALFRIPQLAIHLNRDVNDKGLVLNKQKHLSPIYAQTLLTKKTNPNSLLDNMISDVLKVNNEDILSWELELYDQQLAQFGGHENAFVYGGRLDNLAMCHAALTALLAIESPLNQTGMIALFDSEEIGSNTVNGAASSFIRDVTERILGYQELTRETTLQGLANSFCISADSAHAVHPNYSEYHDENHAVEMNKGPVIKVNANQRYATNAETAAIFSQLCNEVNVPVQQYIHRTDLPCGSTIGPITASNLGVPVVDVGNAMLSMHSIRETAGSLDQDYMIRVMRHFFMKDDLRSV